MTESTGGGSYLSPADHQLPGKLTSCGRPWPRSEMAILGPDGALLGDDEIGEIAIRGGIVMRRYWNRDQATAETLAGGWLHTGDLGFRDADGFFFVRDRIKDMIVSGGENVYPAEVEDLIAGHEAVAEVAVAGVEDEKFGQALKAWVVLKQADSMDGKQIRAFVKDNLASYKAPRDVIFLPELPRNATGKILKRSLE